MVYRKVGVRLRTATELIGTEPDQGEKAKEEQKYAPSYGHPRQAIEERKLPKKE